MGRFFVFVFYYRFCLLLTSLLKFFLTIFLSLVFKAPLLPPPPRTVLKKRNNPPKKQYLPAPAPLMMSHPSPAWLWASHCRSGHLSAWGSRECLLSVYFLRTHAVAQSLRLCSPCTVLPHRLRGALLQLHTRTPSAPAECISLFTLGYFHM